MILLYSGTPRSGKSLHAARVIYNTLKFTDCEVICNFPINLSYFKPQQQERFHFLPNRDIKPDFLMRFSEEYFQRRPAKGVRDAEGKIRLYIDESQNLFNSRQWQRNYMDGWIDFFSLHGHLGYDICLMAQYDRMLDRQVRCLIEYEYCHRKISNVGKQGKLVNLLAGGGLFYCTKSWYPQKMRVGGEFFRFRKKFNRLYDTHAVFTREGCTASVTAAGVGGPAAGADAVKSLPENP